MTEPDIVTTVLNVWRTFVIAAALIMAGLVSVVAARYFQEFKKHRAPLHKHVYIISLSYMLLVTSVVIDQTSRLGVGLTLGRMPIAVVAMGVGIWGMVLLWKQHMTNGGGGV